MTRSRCSGIILVVLCALTASCASTPEVKTPERPNIVVFLVDDLGWKDFGVTGSPTHRTPSVDRLAREGVLFTNAYAASCVCSPSRAALLTGMSPARLKITDWIPGATLPNTKLTPPKILNALPETAETIAERLQAAGYATWHVGKWHLGGQGSSPLDHGFAVNVGGGAAGHPATYFHPYGNDRPNTAYAVKNLPAGGQAGEYLTDRLTDEAVRLLRGHGGAPFFLYLSHYAVHTPLEAKPEAAARHMPTGMSDQPTRAAKYAAMVESVDESLGRLLTTLVELGLDDSTVIIVTSDNGGEKSSTDNRPLRDAKGTLYEGGIRVPLLVHGPGALPQGSRRDQPVLTTDLFSTIARLAGVPVVDSRQPNDGRDLARLLADPSASTDRQALVWHYPHYHTPKRPPCSAIRVGDLKLIEFYEDGRRELYDLACDPGETQDLAAARPEDVARLLTALRDSLKESAAGFPTAK